MVYGGPGAGGGVSYEQARDQSAKATGVPRAQETVYLRGAEGGGGDEVHSRGGDDEKVEEEEEREEDEDEEEDVRS